MYYTPVVYCQGDTVSMIYDAFLMLLSPPCCYYYYYLKNANAKAMMQSQLLRIGLK